GFEAGFCPTTVPSIIPATIQGLPVTSIGDEAFWDPRLSPPYGNCLQMWDVTIPDSVTNIGRRAFYDTGLVFVTVGDGVLSIGDEAFSSGYQLSAIVFRGDAPRLGQFVFNSLHGTVYYLPGTTGWGPTFGGLPTALWTPENQLQY